MNKAVIFDLDNTLYDYDRANLIARKHLAEMGADLLRVGVDKFLEAYDQANREVKSHMGKSASCHNRMLYSQRTAEILGGRVLDVAPKLYDAYWDKLLEVMELYPGARDFLAALKEKGVAVGICTDMTAHIQYRKLLRFELAPYVDAVVTSEEMGVEKPHAAMFHAALDKLKVSGGEAVYVGDSWERDIEGARNVGITPVWFVADRPHQEQPSVLTVTSYSDPRLREICLGD